MLHLFRKIRQKLVAQNKLSKYLVYALGEIVLVVIGILIALQINNWKEATETKQEEFKLLKDVKTELESALEILNSAIIFQDKSISACDTIEYYLKNKPTYHQKLDSCFGLFPHNFSVFVNTAAFASLKNAGVSIVSNEALKKDIINMYDVYFLNLPDYTVDENLLRANVVFPFYSKHISYSKEDTYKARPTNFENLKNDEAFLNMLRLIRRQRVKGKERFIDIKTPLELLIKNLDDELKQKND